MCNIKEKRLVNQSNERGHKKLKVSWAQKLYSQALDIPEITNFAYKASFTFKNILSGFKSTGIWSINDNVFDENIFLASRVIHELKINTTSTNLRHLDLLVGKRHEHSRIC